MAKTKNLWLIKLALGIAGRKKLKQLDTKSKDCRSAQEAVLDGILGWAAETEYGKKHGFGEIKTLEDFQRKVPINTYESLEPYIKRHTNGEAGVLFPGKPMMYATTSGTTAEPKWIPVTQKYYKECYSGVSALWFYSMLKECPRVFDGPEMSIVGKPIEGYAPDGTVHGSLSGQVRKHIPKFLKEVHSLPDEVYGIEDYYTRYYCIMRLCVEQDIHLIVTGNPSTLLELHNTVQSHLDDFIVDIEAGTFKADLDISKGVREALETWKSVRPNPKRASELRKLKELHGALSFKHFWPNLQLITTWKCGNSGLYLERAKEYIPASTRIREFGYLASEVRAGYVLSADDDSTILGGHLAFFEFIRKEDIDDDTPRVFLAHEVEEGQEYYLVVTTQAGLYRYDMNDLVRVEGFYNTYPKFRFLQKGAGVTSLTGEKLTEQQFIPAVKESAAHLGLTVLFFIGFGDVETSAYQVFAEFEGAQGDNMVEEFRKMLDDKLRAANVEYESKRASFRVKDLVVHRLPPQSFDRFKAMCMEAGYRDGQFKLTHLLIDNKRMEMFKKLSAEVQVESADTP